MSSSATWISGIAQSGKTTALIEHIALWLEEQSTQGEADTPQETVLVFAPNSDNRSVLQNRILQRIQAQGSITTTTPLAFFENEMLLFWPLILEHQHLKGYFPLRLRPETEQLLALQLWGDAAIATLQQWEAVSPDRWGRRVLDIIQLAAFGGISLEHISARLQSFCHTLHFPDSAAEFIQTLALQWQTWCLDRGLLTYGLITDLFWRLLLPNPTYQEKLQQRFSALAADDVDNYPAIAGQLFQTLMEFGLPSVFTYDPLGGLRRGLGADPDALQSLAHRCESIELPSPSHLDNAPLDLNALFQTILLEHHPACYTLRTTTRIQLLQDVAQGIIEAVTSGRVSAAEIALIAPGLDTLARHHLQSNLNQAGIAVESLRDQRPLQTDPMVRALLTLLALIYPNLGHLLNQEHIAEMLVVLTVAESSDPKRTQSKIDPIRAALLAEYCFRPHPQTPELLPAETFPRWDRLGYVTTQAYTHLCQWIDRQKTQTLSQREASQSPQRSSKSSAYLTLNPVYVLDRALQTFLMVQPLSVDQLAVLREFMETAQHFWDIEGRLRQIDAEHALINAVEQFIQLLRRGVITANPYPVDRSLVNRDAVTLATTYQYLNARLSHRWQLWLDASSPMWVNTGNVPLWGAEVFLHPTGSPGSDRSSEPFTLENEAVQARFANGLKGLMARSQQIYFCHSDLAANGQTQFGPLLPWVEMAAPLTSFADIP